MAFTMFQGRLTSDPETEFIPSGKQVTKFSVAESKGYKKVDGEEHEPNYFDCVAWEGQAKLVAERFVKGKPILIKGDLQTRSYIDKQGNKRKVYEVIVRNLEFALSDPTRDTQGTGAAPQQRSVESGISAPAMDALDLSDDFDPFAT